MSKSVLKEYLKRLTSVFQRGDAREESFYSSLEQLLVAYGQQTGQQEVQVTTLPKQTEAGNPDFRIWDGSQHVIGYVEAKAPTEEHLQSISESEQLQRYRSTFPNLILTNFFEFRLYRNGELIDSAQIARPFVATKLGGVPPLENADDGLALLERFFSFSLPKAYTAETLATALAVRTRFLRDEVVALELKHEKERGAGELLGFYEAFKQYLIGTLTPEDFADLYAQTITYGLFAARVRSGEEFQRRLAFEAIPHTIGILRDIFRYISLGDLPTSLECIVDDIAEVLAVADVRGILHRYFHEGKGADPIVHFYETFLAKYDPAERERRGVYYTPESVVSYIVRSLHTILKEEFGKPDGLAAPDVTLLDPAAGTMTFVAKAAQVAMDEFVNKYGEGSRGSFLHDHILENFYAFELMMAPYAIGHLKMAFFLEELGYRLKPQERVKFYLTNTLEMEELAEAKLPGLSSLAHESHLAGEVKRDRPILVILGNPPYSVNSINKSVFINREMDAYKETVRDERNLMPLSDDYVKFLRFAEWKITQAGEGVLGMITNHSYLDNPTFRGMRQHLMDTFDEIYVLDLHGNSLKKEKCPDGSKDENVFDIRQGVAIAFFVKKNHREGCKVFHSECWGLRDFKYSWLEKNNRSSTNWQEIHPHSEFYLFVPRNEESLEDYNQFTKITDIFPVNSTGIKTHRDHFVFDFDREVLKRRIRTFLDPNLPVDVVRETFKLKDNRDWQLAEKRRLIQEDTNWGKRVVPCLYRPFDVRWLFYHNHAIDFGREEVMRHMLAGENLALGVTRNVEIGDSFHHIFCTNKAMQHHAVSLKEVNYLLPLYIYPSANRQELFAHHEPEERQPNLNPRLIETLRNSYGEKTSSESFFYYIYAILYAPTYREKYAQFLKIDFPRIPFTKDFKLFQALAALGQRLVDIHLLRSSELEAPIARFQGEGDSVTRMGKNNLRYDAEKERVYINTSQYFEGVSSQVWQYQTGGYQVCHKWFKDRKDRWLTLDEIRTYCRIVTALDKTIGIQSAIDKLYPQVEKSLLEVDLTADTD